jgi:uncharacterized protein YndB with AHSA1/START domain
MKGHLVLADISGYTRFLTESELEHANGIITDLLNAVIASIQAPLTVSSIEGDAVFMYGSMPDDVQGQTVIESVESLYSAFAGALETMVLNTTCQCNACANINTLGMKIVMHCGEYVTSEIGGRETVSGPDVIMAHRLLKNHITEATGIADYMLVTQACVDELDIESIVEGWAEHTEEYEHVGEIKGYVSSLSELWAFVREQNENKVPERDAWISLSTFGSAPPSVIWDHLIDPQKRRDWMNVEDVVTTGATDGRIGPGAEYHCAHGDDTESVFTILDMRPGEYITFMVALDDHMAMRYTDYLIPSGSGTRLLFNAASLFSTDTGEVLPEEVQANMKGALTDRNRESGARLVAMANAAAKLVGV